MSVAIDGIAPRGPARVSIPPAVFDILLRIEVVPPIVHDGAADFGGGVGGLDGGGVSNAVVGDLVIREGDRVNVAMHGIPPARLVVEVVDGYSAIGCGAEFAYEVGDPRLGPG